MDDARCRQFFLEPTETYHRQYEALRAFFVEKRRLKDIAQQFGYQESYLRFMVCRFRAEAHMDNIHPFLFNQNLGDPLEEPLPPRNRSGRKRRRSPTAGG
jgi:hypothetical protein